MTQKTPTYPTPAHQEADRLLAEIREVQEQLAAEEFRAGQALLVVKQRWALSLAPLQAERDRLDRALKALEKARRVEFFGDQKSCRVQLAHGALLYEKAPYVVKPRKVDVLALLERYGFEEAIKRTAAVDWDALADWTDEELTIIGTRREHKETFGYDVG